MAIPNHISANTTNQEKWLSLTRWLGMPLYPKALFVSSQPGRDWGKIHVCQPGSDSRGFNPGFFCVRLNPPGIPPRSIPCRSPSFLPGKKTWPSSRGTNPQPLSFDLISHARGGIGVSGAAEEGQRRCRGGTAAQQI
jgi:hypothetical protein